MVATTAHTCTHLRQSKKRPDRADLDGYRPMTITTWDRPIQKVWVSLRGALLPSPLRGASLAHPPCLPVRCQAALLASASS